MVGPSERSEPTFYETLRVAESASAAEIRAAYRERAKDTHPDVNDDPDAVKRFQRVKRAHEVLGDARERRRYDRLGHEAYVARSGTRGAGADAPAEERASDTGTSRDDDGPEDSEGSETDAAQGQEQRADRHGRHGRRWNDNGRTKGEHAEPGGPGGPSGPMSQGSDGAGRANVRRGAAAPPGGVTGRTAFGLARWLRFAGALLEAWQARLGPAGAAIALAVFSAYPVLLASTVTPLFPVGVNVLAGMCLLGVLGYLVVRPAVGVAVLGTWLLVLPVVLTVSGIGLVSLGGLYALVTTGVPLGLCVATLLGLSI